MKIGSYGIIYKWRKECCEHKYDIMFSHSDENCADSLNFFSSTVNVLKAKRKKKNTLVLTCNLYTDNFSQYTGIMELFLSIVWRSDSVKV